MRQQGSLTATMPKDLTASVVVFLVALPLCLGVALASNAPLFSGLLSGIIGGIVVGALSGSHKSVSGPAAGLTAIVAAQIATLGTFESFLLAVAIAGALQVLMGVSKLGFIAAFFPGSVIKGLLAAIGVILILKQIPHVFGHDADANGEMSFLQPDQKNTFTELFGSVFDIQPGAALVGILGIAILVAWDRIKLLKKSPVPAALVVVGMGVLVNMLLERMGSAWAIAPSHLVQVPVAQSVEAFAGLLRSPDFSQLGNPAVYGAAITIAIVATLETLLNLEAVDKIDPDQRNAPPNRELIAQGIGNMTAGLIGGLPMTSVIVRSSVNINAGGRTKLAAIMHGVLLLLCVALMPGMLNRIPLSALAAILIMTGLKLASPSLLRQMWREGKAQFLPFAITVVAIILTDLLVGIMVGLAVAIGFILRSNLRRPLQTVLERHISGDVLRIELANQVSFLNRARLETELHAVPRGGHVLIDARNTHYIDPDILDLIEDFRTTTAAAHGVELSLVGFKAEYPLEDHIRYLDYTSRELQSALTPERVLTILREGNARFRSGTRLTRDLGRQVDATKSGQFPMAIVLSCIDSRTPAEMIFDLGLGDIFSARIAGNIARDKVLGSMEYSCAVAGAKVILVMGHTSCGAVNAAVDLLAAGKTAAETLGCDNLDGLLSEIQLSVDPHTLKQADAWQPGEKVAYANDVAKRNVLHTMRAIRERSRMLDRLVHEGKVAIVGSLYDVSTGAVSFFGTGDSGSGTTDLPLAAAV